MCDQPTGDQLLETARDVLRDELIPALPSEKRHAALMIANAMTIAMRQLRNGDENERQELVALQQILGYNEPSRTNNDRVNLLIDCNRCLCQWIREGRADSGQLHDLVWKHLIKVTRHRVTESNPKYLEGASQ